MADEHPLPASAVHLTLITIVAEALLERRLTRAVLNLGATGYTVSPAHGEGSRNSRSADLQGGNVRIEVLASFDVATRILQHVEAEYFEHYAVIAWVVEVGVLRGEKYLSR